MSRPLRLPEPFTVGDLRLRPPTTDDLDRITAVCQDPQIQRWTRVPVPYGRGDAASFVALATHALRSGTGAHLLVERAGEVVAAVGAAIDPIDDLAVVGYWTAPEARRQGLTAAAVRGLCRWLLDDVQVARIELEAGAPNAASNAVARSLGFTLEGVSRQGMLLSAVGELAAERVDANRWGLLPGELL